MTDPFDEYGDRLRRALNAQAESFQPSADGLERIRDRIEAKGARIQIPWWRPTLAVGGALAILSAVVFSTPDLRDQALDAIANVTQRGAPTEPTGGTGYPGNLPGGPSATGTGTPLPSGSPSVDPSTASTSGPDTCPSSVPTFVTPTATAAGAAHLLPTPTCSTEPTPSPTPTPTPSDTPTTDPPPSNPDGGDPTPQPDPTGTTSSETGGSGTDGTQSGETLSDGSGTTGSGTE